MNLPKLDEKMTRYPYIADRKMTALDAANYMHQCNIRHLPVIDSNRLLGIVTEPVIKLANAFQGPGQLLVEDVMDTTPYCIDEKSSLIKVIQSMVETKKDYVLALNTIGQVVGIFTSINALVLLLEYLNATEDQTNLHLYYASFLNGGSGS